MKKKENEALDQFKSIQQQFFEFQQQYFPKAIKVNETDFNLIGSKPASNRYSIGSKSEIFLGDNIEILKTISSNSLDASITDGPYGIDILGNEWDKSVPSVELWKEVFRVLKPGAFVASFGSPKTSHKMVANMENAGFELQGQINWVYAPSMSKSKSIPMLIDNHLGNPNKCNQKGKASKKCAAGTNNQNRDSMLEYVPISPEAKMWDGYGSARVKSAFTPIIIAQKPLSEINIAANVLKWGTGAINIADCLIEGHSTDPSFKGRFPTDIILECICSRTSIEDIKIGKKIKKVIRHVNPNCPCYQMDQQSGITSQGHWSKNKTSGYGAFGGGNSQYLGTGKKDTVYGGASRFFKIIYTNKASKRDKEEGLGYIPGSKVRSNTHPTVKPTDLMQELVCLLAPKGSKIIDPYFGAGSTGKGAIRAGRGCSGELEYNFIGIEICNEYFDIAVKRCQYEYEQSISDHDSVA